MLQKDFTWAPQHNEAIWTIFESKGSARLRDMFAEARRTGVRPSWIGENVWRELLATWATPEFSRKREQAKQNRLSDVGGLGPSLHTGGSIPHTEHSRRLVSDF